MPPKPLIRQIKKEYDTSRPRDAAIAQAAKDEERDYSPNTATTYYDAYPTTDQTFNSSYLRQGLQPSVGSIQPTRNIEVKHRRNTSSRRGNGTNMRAVGKTAQAGGRALSRGGVAVARAGAALSTTGLGAVVGVPLMAAGAGMTATGAAASATGKTIETTGNAVKNTGKFDSKRNSRLPRLGNRNIPSPLQSLAIASTLAAKAKVTRVNIMLTSWCMTLWLMLQLPAAILSIIFFGLTYAVHDVLPDLINKFPGGFILNAITYAFSSLGELAEKLLGFNPASTIDPANFFLMTYFVATFIGLFTLLLIGIVYQLSSIRCLFGDHSTPKIIVFVVALCFYLIPILNIFPWFIFWTIMVWRYPE